MHSKVLAVARNLIASDQTIKAVKPGDPRKRLNDGDGLFLLLFVKGRAHGWRFAYSLHGKRNNLSLGVYPDVGLAQARKNADAARTLVAAGVDPSDARKSDKVDIERKREADRLADAGLPSADSFEGVAREWYETRKGEWSTSYGEKILARLVADIFPYIGRRPIGEITPPQLLEVLRRIESRGVVETAHRARENCSQVFRFAMSPNIGLTPARFNRALPVLASAGKITLGLRGRKDIVYVHPRPNHWMSFNSTR